MGHSNNTLNNKADALAKRGLASNIRADIYQRARDINSGFYWTDGYFRDIKVSDIPSVTENRTLSDLCGDSASLLHMITQCNRTKERRLTTVQLIHLYLAESRFDVDLMLSWTTEEPETPTALETDKPLIIDWRGIFYRNIPKNGSSGPLH